MFFFFDSMIFSLKVKVDCVCNKDLFISWFNFVYVVEAFMFLSHLINKLNKKITWVHFLSYY